MRRGYAGHKAWRVLGVVAALLLVAGCGLQYLDPGPNPAMARVRFEAAVSQTQVQHTITNYGIDIAQPNWRFFSRGPLWSWQLLLIQPDGNLVPLRPVAGGPFRFIEGMGISQEGTFAVPPGPHKVRLLVQALLLVKENDPWAGNMEHPYYVATYTQDFDLDLGAAQTGDLTARFRP